MRWGPVGGFTCTRSWEEIKQPPKAALSLCLGLELGSAWQALRGELKSIYTKLGREPVKIWADFAAGTGTESSVRGGTWCGFHSPQRTLAPNCSGGEVGWEKTVRFPPIIPNPLASLVEMKGPIRDALVGTGPRSGSGGRASAQLQRGESCPVLEPQVTP